MSYWDHRRICSTNAGLPPAVKRQRDTFPLWRLPLSDHMSLRFFVVTVIDKIISFREQMTGADCSWLSDPASPYTKNNRSS